MCLVHLAPTGFTSRNVPRSETGGMLYHSPGSNRHSRGVPATRGKNKPRQPIVTQRSHSNGPGLTVWSYISEIRSKSDYPRTPFGIGTASTALGVECGHHTWPDAFIPAAMIVHQRSPRQPIPSRVRFLAEPNMRHRAFLVNLF